MPRRYLKVVYDVTGFTDEEIGGLEIEAVVQGEASERHPDVAGKTESYVFDSDLMGVHESSLQEVRRWTNLYLNRNKEQS
jgi:hypothetical protein